MMNSSISAKVTKISSNHHEKNFSRIFFTGLEFNERFPISQILADHDLYPGHTYSSEEIIDTMKDFLNGSNPALECEKMHDFKLPVLTQISVCLDKELNVMGCDNTFGGVYGRCPKRGFIEFPLTENKYNNGKSGSRSFKNEHLKLSV